MSSTEEKKLAIDGGKPAVTIDDVQARKWPKITEEEISAVVEQMREGQLSIYDRLGVIAEFEDNFARRFGIKYALTRCNGTSALHSAYFALGIGPGDEVILPSYTWMATATPILHVNGVPVFCEINPKTLTADPEDIEEKVRDTIKAAAPGGGFILSTSDSIRDGTPIENVRAFFDSGRKYGSYPIR